VGNSADDPSTLPPGPERREALLDAGMAVSFADFTPEELRELVMDLDEIRRSTGLGLRHT